MPNIDYTLELVNKALEDLENHDCRLSTITRKALRIARLRNDWNAVYWLQIELDGFFDKNAITRHKEEVATHLSREAFNQLHIEATEASFTSRSIILIDPKGNIDDDKLLCLGIQEIEENIDYLTMSYDPLPDNLHPLDAAVFSEKRYNKQIYQQHLAKEYQSVLARLTQRVHSYLSQVERELILGQLKSDVFNNNRLYVDDKLQQIAPEILEQLHIAYRRTREGTIEARSHSLTSCRRALKALADLLYPSTETPVSGIDGKERILNDSMYVARLWQFIADSQAGSTARRILNNDIERLGKRVDRLNDLAAKGIHADVTEFEVNLCVLELYNVTGALLRLLDEISTTTTSTSTSTSNDP